MSPATAAPIESWTGRRVLVVGLARSGRAVAELLAGHGARVRGTDAADAATLGLAPADWESRGIELRLGGHRPEDFADVELAVLSPGIPKTASVVQDLLARGIPIASEIEIASRFARAPILAVTGTNGKSTTVTVLGQLLAALGDPVEVAGNIGLALSTVVTRVPPEGYLVVEVSSYQLEDVATFHARGAALLNVTPDHLDRYPSLDAYAATKARIFERQGPEDAAVVPAADPHVEPHLGRLRARCFRFGAGSFSEGVAVEPRGLLWRRGGRETLIAGPRDLSLPGPHNQANIAAALALLGGIGKDLTDPRLHEALGRLHGLPHRLERIEGPRGVACWNDSKATNPDSLEVALRSFPGKVVLLAGGRPKESDYGTLTPLIAERVALAILLGEAAPRLAASWRGAGTPLVDAGRDFPSAVRRALTEAETLGLPVLLSPGCASFDMFRDYEDRGDQFRRLVLEAARAAGGGS